MTTFLMVSLTVLFGMPTGSQGSDGVANINGAIRETREIKDFPDFGFSIGLLPNTKIKRTKNAFGQETIREVLFCISPELPGNRNESVMVVPLSVFQGQGDSNKVFNGMISGSLGELVNTSSVSKIEITKTKYLNKYEQVSITQSGENGVSVSNYILSNDFIYIIGSVGGKGWDSNPSSKDLIKSFKMINFNLIK